MRVIDALADQDIFEPHSNFCRPRSRGLIGIHGVNIAGCVLAMDHPMFWASSLIHETSFRFFTELYVPALGIVTNININFLENVVYSGRTGVGLTIAWICRAKSSAFEQNTTDGSLRSDQNFLSQFIHRVDDAG